MRLLFIFFLPAISVFLFSQHATPRDEEPAEISGFGDNPGNLRMFLYNPFDTPDTLHRPLVLVLHGCTQDAHEVAEQSGWDKLAKQYHFYVLYPQQKFINNPNSCFDWFLPGDFEKDQGECRSIRTMIDYVTQHYIVDTTRIFVTGLSAGAAMSVALLADYPSLFHAGAVFAGGPFGSATNPFTAGAAMLGNVSKTPQEWGAVVREQNPGYTGEYPRLFIYQGASDPVVNPRNAWELVKQWTALHNTDTIADTTVFHFQNNAAVTEKIYCDKNNTPVVTEYLIRNFGHALPVVPGDCRNEGGETGLFAKNIGVHSTWWTASGFGLVDDRITMERIPPDANHSDTLFRFTVLPQKGAKYEWSFTGNCTVKRIENNTAVVSWVNGPGRVTVTETDSAGCVFHFNSVNAGQ